MQIRLAPQLVLCTLILGCTPPNTPEPPPPPPPVAHGEPVSPTPVEPTSTPPVTNPPVTISPIEPDRPTNVPVPPTSPKQAVNVSEQIEKLTNDAERNAAASALASVGKSAVPALLKSLDHTDWQVRAAVVFALGQIGKDASEAKGRLQAIVEKDENAEVRNAAAFALDAIENK